MASLAEPLRRWIPPWPVPLLYEDEVDEMGDHDLHTWNNDIISLGLEQHLAESTLRVFKDLNMYYSPPPGEEYPRRPCVAADTMLVESWLPRDEHPSSYDVDRDGPPPVLTVEVLSDSTADDVDLAKKPLVYAYLGVREYVLVDTTGEHLPEKLLLKRLQTNGEWVDHRDADGGVTSELGFRIVIDDDGDLRVTDLEGERYARPREVHDVVKERDRALSQSRRAKRQAEAAKEKADAAAERIAAEVAARKLAEDKARQLELELERLRKLLPGQNT